MRTLKNEENRKNKKGNEDNETPQSYSLDGYRISIVKQQDQIALKKSLRKEKVQQSNLTNSNTYNQHSKCQRYTRRIRKQFPDINYESSSTQQLQRSIIKGQTLLNDLNKDLDFFLAQNQSQHKRVNKIVTTQQNISLLQNIRICNQQLIDRRRKQIQTIQIMVKKVDQDEIIYQTNGLSKRINQLLHENKILGGKSKAKRQPKQPQITAQQCKSLRTQYLNTLKNNQQLLKKQSQLDDKLLVYKEMLKKTNPNYKNIMSKTNTKTSQLVEIQSKVRSDFIKIQKSLGLNIKKQQQKQNQITKQIAMILQEIKSDDHAIQMIQELNQKKIQQIRNIVKKVKDPKIRDTLSKLALVSNIQQQNILTFQKQVSQSQRVLEFKSVYSTIGQNPILSNAHYLQKNQEHKSLDCSPQKQNLRQFRSRKIQSTKPHMVKRPVVQSCSMHQSSSK